MLRAIRILLTFLLLTGTAAAAHAERTLLVFGDSLSAAYGLRADQGWVVHLQKRLKAEGYGYRVVNASVSGETTSGGKSRIERALTQHQPQLVILELGGNDGLRGLPVKDAQANLATMIGAIQRHGARLLLAGIRIPHNYGPRYATDFSNMYGALATSRKIPLVPFLLDGIALNEQYMQADGIHPNAAGQPLVLKNLWPALKPLLER
jgi:acyl-CoA thioesterase I